VNEHVRALDGIRAVAVLAVLLFHAESLSAGTTRFQGGFLGVSVFFTLSGFLIGGQVLREHEHTGTVAVAPFTRRRIARLAPVALVVVLAVVLLTRTPVGTWNAFGGVDALSALWQFTNWHLAWLPDSAGFRLVHPLTHFWSLSVEVQFYAATGLAVTVLRRGDLCTRLTRLALLGWWCSLAMALVLHSTVRREEFGTDVRLAEFAAGVLLAVWLPRIDVRTVRIAGPFAALVLPLAVLFVGREEFWLSNGGYALLSVLWAVWIAAVHHEGALRKACSWAPLVWLGTISYSLYAVHWPVVLALPDSRLHLSGWWAVVVRCAVSLVAAALLHRLVEQPLRRRLASVPTGRLVGGWLGATVVVSGVAVAVLAT
jgi:peptidoglycan/LPS O-acetylase OafA/YrhL